MDVTAIKRIGRELEQFEGCFSRSEARDNLQIYVQGQLSDLERKFR